MLYQNLLLEPVSKWFDFHINPYVEEKISIETSSNFEECYAYNVRKRSGVYSC